MTTTADISIGLYNALYGVVSENVYDAEVPNMLPDTVKDFIVYNVDSVRPMYDYDNGSTVRSYVQIECYAKNKANGIKNTAKIKELLDGLNTLVKNNPPYRMSLSSIQPMAKRINDFNGESIIYNILK